MPAHSFLKTPFGKRASARFQYVIAGAMASTRWSYPAASSEIAPPYEAPVTPTRGSPGLSSRTSGLLGQPVDQLGDVGDLALGVVQPDLAGGPAESACRPGQHRVAVPGQLLRLLPYVVLAAAEAVRQQDGGAACAAGAGREERGVDTDAVHGHDPVAPVHRGCVVGGDGRPCPGTGEHDDGGPGGQQAPGPPKQPSQAGHSKIHASTVRGVSDSWSSLGGEGGALRGSTGRSACTAVVVRLRARSLLCSAGCGCVVACRAVPRAPGRPCGAIKGRVRCGWSRPRGGAANRHSPAPLEAFAPPGLQACASSGIDTSHRVSLRGRR